MSELPRVSEQLEYLVNTDEVFGQLRGRVKALEYRMKVAEAVGYMESEGTQEMRKAQARCSDKYKAMLDEYQQACIEMHTIEARRNTAALQIEVWRSQQANRRSGNI